MWVPDTPVKDGGAKRGYEEMCKSLSRAFSIFILWFSDTNTFCLFNPWVNTCRDYVPTAEKVKVRQYIASSSVREE